MESSQWTAAHLPTQVTYNVSVRVATMSLLCAFLVILIHANHIPIEGSLSSSLFKIGVTITRIAVPFFFCAAGYFLAGRTHEYGWYKRETLKRVRSLLIPLWLGSLITFLWSIPLILGANWYKNEPLLRNFPQSLQDWLAIFALNPLVNPLTPFWFLRTLFIFVVLSPILVFFVRRSKYVALGCLLCTYCAYSMFNYYSSIGEIPKDSYSGELFTWLFSLRDLFFFTAGMVIRYYPIRIPMTKTSNFLSGLGVIFAIFLSHYLELRQFITLPILVLCVYLSIPTIPLPQSLSACAFPVYVLHMIPLSLINMIVRNVPQLSFLQTTAVGWMAIGGSTMLICIIICKVMRKIMPNFSILLFGAR